MSSRPIGRHFLIQMELCVMYLKKRTLWVRRQNLIENLVPIC